MRIIIYKPFYDGFICEKENLSIAKAQSHHSYPNNKMANIFQSLLMRNISE